MNSKGNMLTSTQQQRFGRQLKLTHFDAQLQQTIINSTVIVIGVGGLGCPFIQYAAAAGFGNFVLIDHDTVDISNLNRQILYTQ